jgi:hypothetical protein
VGGRAFGAERVQERRGHRRAVLVAVALGGVRELSVRTPDSVARRPALAAVVRFTGAGSDQQ